MHRGVPQSGLIALDQRQRDRGAGHVERRHIGADERPRGLDSGAFDDSVRLVVEEVELAQRGRAEAVDQQDR